MKLLLAPMATISHEAFRRAVTRFGGCDELYNEMIHAPSLLAGGAWEQYYLRAETEPEKLVWQLTGNRAAPLVEAAALLARRSGIGIDLNMGCAAPQIVHTGAGIAWMEKPLTETAALVRGVKAALANAAKDGATEKRLSVKLRLGSDDFTDKGFLAFCDMLVGEGVQQLTLHPRTKKETYRAKPRWEYVERLALRYEGRVPIVLNGNVTDKESLTAAMQTAPHAAGVMIARAAVQKPWIFAELRRSMERGRSAQPIETAAKCETTTVDCEQLALNFIDDLARFQPPAFYQTRLQRFFSYYCDNFSFAHYFKTQVLNAASHAASPADVLKDCKAQVCAYFAQCPDDRLLQQT